MCKRLIVSLFLFASIVVGQEVTNVPATNEPAPAEREPKLWHIEAAIDLYSKYYQRGVNMNDAFTVAPSVRFSYRNFEAGIWAALTTDLYVWGVTDIRGDLSGDDTGLTEIDVFVSYARRLPVLDLVEVGGSLTGYVFPDDLADADTFFDAASAEASVWFVVDAVVFPGAAFYISDRGALYAEAFVTSDLPMSRDLLPQLFANAGFAFGFFNDDIESSVRHEDWGFTSEFSFGLGYELPYNVDLGVSAYLTVPLLFDVDPILLDPNDFIDTAGTPGANRVIDLSVSLGARWRY